MIIFAFSLRVFPEKDSDFVQNKEPNCMFGFFGQYRLERFWFGRFYLDRYNSIGWRVDWNLANAP